MEQMDHVPWAIAEEPVTSRRCRRSSRQSAGTKWASAIRPALRRDHASGGEAQRVKLALELS